MTQGRPAKALNTIKRVIVSTACITVAPKPALQMVWLFQIQSASQNGRRKREGKTVRQIETDSHGRKVPILLF